MAQYREKSGQGKDGFKSGRHRHILVSYGNSSMKNGNLSNDPRP